MEEVEVEDLAYNNTHWREEELKVEVLQRVEVDLEILQKEVELEVELKVEVLQMVEVEEEGNPKVVHHHQNCNHHMNPNFISIYIYIYIIHCTAAARLPLVCICKIAFFLAAANALFISLAVALGNNPSKAVLEAPKN